MKKIMTPEVELLNLNANDVIATSFGAAKGSRGRAEDGWGDDTGFGFVSSRGYYDDEEEEW